MSLLSLIIDPGRKVSIDPMSQLLYKAVNDLVQLDESNINLRNNRVIGQILLSMNNYKKMSKNLNNMKYNI